MSKLIKKYFKILLIIILLIPILISPIVKADSGWDSSYDSGGSWDSGGSYDSSSSYDYDYEYDYYYNGSSSTSDSYSNRDKILIIFIIITITFALAYIAIYQESYTPPENKNKYIKYEFLDISQRLFDTILPNESIALLKKELFIHFIETQNAWMNFEYKELRNLCTDELYNSYMTQLETLKLKHGQNIMHDFNCIDMKITNIEEINDEIILTVFLCVEFYDYVINTKTNKIIRGTNSKRILNNYLMTFVKEKNYKNKKCPNCGAKNENITSGECPYCNSTIVTKASKFVLNSKKNINR